MEPNMYLDSIQLHRFGATLASHRRGPAHQNVMRGVQYVSVTHTVQHLQLELM
jgi:hypothetical protein